MASTTTDQSIRIPDESDLPDVPLVLGRAVADIEKKLFRVYDNDADRQTRNPSPVAGMVAYMKDVPKMMYYSGTAWVQFFPAAVPSITSGTSVPGAGTGANGDVFFLV